MRLLPTDIVFFCWLICIGLGVVIYFCTLAVAHRRANRAKRRSESER